MSLFIFLFSAYLTIISSIDGVVHDFYWRDYTYEDIPCDAYQGAPGLYIGLVNTKGRNIVANIYPSPGHAVTTYDGEVLIVKDDIKIFCSRDQSKFYWENVDFDKPQGKQLQDAVRGGYHDNVRDPLFIGKVMHQGEWKIGKVNTYKHGSKKGIWVWDQRQQPVNIHQFDILKYKTIPDNKQVGLVKNYYWRDYVPGNIPFDAYEGAPGRYVGQMILIHGTSVYLAAATIYPISDTAVSEYVGKKIAKYSFKILCSPDNSRFYWEYVDFDKPNDLQLKEAVIGGFEISNNLFIGKVLHEEEWKISKTMPFEYGTSKGLWVWKGENEAENIHQFFILKYNTTKACHKMQGHSCSIQ